MPHRRSFPIPHPTLSHPPSGECRHRHPSFGACAAASTLSSEDVDDLHHRQPIFPSPMPRGGRCAVRAQAEATGADASDKSLEIMRKFSEQYARRSNTFFCSEKSVTAVVIKGLADHKDQLGVHLCPCRDYDDKAVEVAQGFWNCPCVPMHERKECHCMLFVTPDNDFLEKTRL